MPRAQKTNRQIWRVGRCRWPVVPAEVVALLGMGPHGQLAYCD